MKISRKSIVGYIAAFISAWQVGCPLWAAPAKQRDALDTTWWDPYVENITDTDTYLRRKFRQDVTDKSTGLSQKALKPELARIVADAKAAGESWWITKAKCFAEQVNRQSIDVSPLDWFPAIAVWDRRSRPISGVIKKRAGEVNAKALPGWVKKEWRAGNARGAWNMWQDFDHSVPDWRVILSLGFPGMRARLEKYAVNGDPFYEGQRIAMDAMFSGLDRFIEQGKKNMGGTRSSATLPSAVSPRRSRAWSACATARRKPPTTR